MVASPCLPSTAALEVSISMLDEAGGTDVVGADSSAIAVGCWVVQVVAIQAVEILVHALLMNETREKKF